MLRAPPTLRALAQLLLLCGQPIFIPVCTQTTLLERQQVSRVLTALLALLRRRIRPAAAALRPPAAAAAPAPALSQRGATVCCCRQSRWSRQMSRLPLQPLLLLRRLLLRWWPLDQHRPLQGQRPQRGAVWGCGSGTPALARDSCRLR
jgi:hypothetical protein